MALLTLIRFRVSGVGVTVAVAPIAQARLSSPSTAQPYGVYQTKVRQPLGATKAVNPMD